MCDLLALNLALVSETSCGHTGSPPLAAGQALILQHWRRFRNKGVKSARASKPGRRPHESTGPGEIERERGREGEDVVTDDNDR